MNATLKKLQLALLVVTAALGTLVLSTTTSSAAAPKTRFFEETAQAFWAVPHQCSDGSTVPATLLVESTRDYSAPDTEDLDPTVRVQYLAVCPDGTSYSWIGFLPATISSEPNLKRVHASGSGTVRDILGVTHQVTFDVFWTAVGPLVSTVNRPGSTSKERQATATGHVTFDGQVLVDGAANNPTRPAPFVRTDVER
jgi:hypothetical protein